MATLWTVLRIFLSYLVFSCPPDSPQDYFVGALALNPADIPQDIPQDATSKGLFSSFSPIVFIPFLRSVINPGCRSELAIRAKVALRRSQEKKIPNINLLWR
jgi:hypothetical protein